VITLPYFVSLLLLQKTPFSDPQLIVFTSCNKNLALSVETLNDAHKCRDYIQIVHYYYSAQKFISTLQLHSGFNSTETDKHFLRETFLTVHIHVI
jgi:hypothetical protein